ncbi:ComEA family DNA-binding protein [Pirellulaceae bacterium SH501]
MSDPLPAESASADELYAAPMRVESPNRLANATFSLAAITIMAVGWMVFTEWQERIQEANGLTAAPYVVDLNLATESELHLLPGVGQKLAQQILKLRDERGRFSRIEELLDVPGIKETRLEQIRPYVTIAAASGER